MKAFFVAFLALPAVLAAPAPAPAQDDAWPTTFPFETVKCRCTDGNGRTSDSACLYIGGQRNSENFCYPAVRWSENIGDVFTNDFCKLSDPSMPKAECVSVKICQGLGGSDYFEMC